MYKPGELTERWNERAEKALLGKKIVKVEYMKPEESNNYMWDYRCVTFILNDGTRVIPMCDDEGNNAGVLSCLMREEDEVIEEILPVLRSNDA